MKYVASISERLIMPKNSTVFPNSEKSFGAGVAEQHNLYGVLANVSISSFLVDDVNDFKISSFQTLLNMPVCTLGVSLTLPPRACSLDNRRNRAFYSPRRKAYSTAHCIRV